MLSDAIQFLQEHDSFTFLAHVSPDGDTIGSCLGLFLALRSVGKNVQVVCADPVPKIYQFLPSSDAFLLPEQARQTEAVVAVDCADLERTGDAERLFQHAQFTLNIDHHSTNNRYADCNYVASASAAGELVFQILQGMELPVTRDIAACMYVAVITDTGNFAYSNTTPQTFLISADLLEAGIDLPYLNRMVFRTVPLHKTRLHALAVMRMQLYERGRIAVSMLTRADFRSCEALEEDSEGIIDSLRDIDTVEIAAFLRESSDGSVKVSLRGKSSADVSRIAVKYGGGGHRLAAGCVLHMPISEAGKKILRDALEYLHGAE